MIKRLRGRMILLTMAGLFLASAILVAAINVMNMGTVKRQAEAVLDMLAQNDGRRPGLSDRPAQGDQWTGQTPPDKPEGTFPPDAFQNGLRGEEGLDREKMGGWRNADTRRTANLSNFFLVHLTSEGQVESWESDRAGLYTDEQISALAAEAVASGQASGRAGDQFFRREGSTLIVVDATLEIQSARSYLRATVLVAAVQWALLSLAAVWLIGRMVRPVDEAMEKQKQFVWDASHELKTPLAVISANAEVLSNEIGDNQSLQYIQSEVKRTDQLVQNLLTLARMEKNPTPKAHREFDLSRAVLEVALPFESAVYEAGKTIDMDIPDGLKLNGDEEMIKQLLMILLSNAVKYSDAHGKIALILEGKGDKRVIRVRNTGPAIPAADQEKIFDRFYRVDSSHNRETPGNGLGLAIAKNIVEMHKGKIAVQSEEGKGTEFTVTL